ncbi:hypothetical protein ACFQXA_13025 [Nocardiopsis composta]
MRARRAQPVQGGPRAPPALRSQVQPSRSTAVSRPISGSQP